MLKIPQSFLRSLAIKKQLSEGELEVLYRIAEDKSIEAIADEVHTKSSAIYQRLAQIYSKFQIEGKGPGKLSRLQMILASEYEQYHLSNQYPTFRENDRFENDRFLEISPSHSSNIVQNQSQSLGSLCNSMTSSNMATSSTPFSRKYQPSDWLNKLQQRIDSGEDPNQILNEFQDNLSGAIDYITYPSPPTQLKKTWQNFLFYIEKFFAENENQKNYIPTAKQLKLTLKWMENYSTCSEEKLPVLSRFTQKDQNIPEAQAMKLIKP